MHFFLVKHPLDGLRLALQLGRLEHLTVIGLPLSSLGLNSPGSAGHSLSGRRGEVEVRCLDAAAGPHADLLAYSRRDDDSRQGVVLLYQRLLQDLPPLQPGDQLDCFWEVEDVLRAADLECFEELRQQLTPHPQMFEGLSLYARQAGRNEQWRPRAQELEALLQSMLKPQTYELPVWTGGLS